MPKRTIFGLLLVAAGLLARPVAYADIFRCVDKGGNQLFSDRPCPSGTQTTDITTAVQVCGSADCLQRLAREYQEAQARARAEREQLEMLMEEQHRRAEEEARIEALRAREAPVPEPVAPVEPLDPGYIVGVPLWTCVGAHCLLPPHHLPHRPGYPNVVEPWWNCAGARCFPRPHHPREHRHDAHAQDAQSSKKYSDGRRDHDRPWNAGNRLDGAPRLGVDERSAGGHGRN